MRLMEKLVSVNFSSTKVGLLILRWCLMAIQKHESGSEICVSDLIVLDRLNSAEIVE